MVRQQMQDRVRISGGHNHDRHDSPDSEAVPHAGHSRLQRDRKLELRRFRLPAGKPGRGRDRHVAERAEQKDDSADGSDHRQAVPLAVFAVQRGAVDPARKAAQAGDVIADAEQRLPGKP